jgi:hypothetical protein
MAEKKLYLGKVWALNAFRRKTGKFTMEYTKAFSVAQAKRDLYIRFPFPKYLIDEPRLDERQK